MRNALRIGRLFGIDFRVDTSWLFIFVLVTWSLTSLFSTWHPAWTFGTSLAVAAVAALVFFASVLFHELAHALVARAYGLPVRDITLFMFGGVSNIEREPPTPLSEFLIAIVGPIASIGLGVAMMIVGALLTDVRTATVETAPDVIARLGPLSTLLMWLGPVNVMVGLFNLIPGFPLDGGRILRAILWKLSGSLRRATAWAAGVGQFVGWAFIVMGVFMVLGYRVPFFGHGLGGGIWLGLIGLFLRNAAVQQQRGAVVHELLDGKRVADLMRTTGGWVAADMPVRLLVDQYFMRHDEHAFPVFDRGQFVGVVSLEDVRRIPPDDWPSRAVHHVMTPRERLVTATPDEDLLGAIQKLAPAGVRQLPVLANGNLVGMLLEQDIARWLKLESTNHGGEPPRRPRHA